jgi:preprotein translocase subunit SecE
MRVCVNNKRFSSMDFLFSGLAVVLFAAGVAGNIYFSEQAIALRAAAWIVLAMVIVLLVIQTTYGKLALHFLKEARVELRKVVWPGRQQTLQTGLIVFVMVVITSLLLWGIDSLLIWAIGFLTGQRG